MWTINNAFPFLAATPDGKLCENGECGIVEIKCPYLARDLSISEACYQIKKNHAKRGKWFDINK